MKVEVLVALDDESTVQIFDANLEGQYRKFDGTCHSVAYYVMELAEHGELFQFLHDSPKFDERMARYYFSQLLKGFNLSQGSSTCSNSESPTWTSSLKTFWSAGTSA